MNENNGYIKIHRKFLDWEWYADINTKVVFLHCLLMANWKDGRFMGYEIPRGSFATSYANLAEQTGLTKKQIRTALEHLKRTQEVALKRTPKFSIITVINYCKYQDDGTDKGTQGADEGHTKGTQGATIEEGKKGRKKENISHEPEHRLYGIYHNVRLTDAEMQELINQYPNDYQEMIENLSTYMRSKGKLYEDHFATMMRWKHEDEEKAKQKTDTKTKRRNLIEEIRNA